MGPMDASFGQATYESPATDIMKFFPRHDPKLDFTDKDDRRKILEFVYRGSPWVNLDAIEATCEELLPRDPAQARRFFGCELVQGLGSYMPEASTMTASTSARIRPTIPRYASASTVPSPATVGDSRRDRGRLPVHTRLRRGQAADVLESGRMEGRIPRSEVDAAVSDLFNHFKVKAILLRPSFVGVAYR